MLQILVSLAALISAVSFITLANATMTTVMPLRMLQNGADETTVAIFGAAYFLGFTVGCFSEPPRILRIGYIRAFAAAAALCTTLAVVIDMTSWTVLWVVLRFFMGLAIAAIFATVDGWINATTPDATRGKVFATYGWCLGASAVLGQLLMVFWDGLAVGFITILALAFNVAVMLVTLTRASAPTARPDASEGAPAAPRAAGGLVVTSSTAVAAAAYAGLVTTAILSIMPALLASRGVGEVAIGYVIAAFFLGRLVVQIPIGFIADRVDLRLLIAIIAGLTGVTAFLGWFLVLVDVARLVAEATPFNQIVFLLVMVLLGGLILPLYTVANSLAFARAKGQPPVRIATTLLLVNSAGAVAGPLLVAAVMPVLDSYALAAVVVAASAVMCLFALWRRSVLGVHARPATGLSDIPATSLALTETVAEVKAEAAAEADGEDVRAEQSGV
jgi:MFS family permease